MNNHLPECPMAFDDYWNYEPAECCCKQLRACEQRVRDEERDDAQRILIKHGAQQFVIGERMGRTFGYTAGVQAAREAVLNAGLCAPHRCQSDALAAIDALRGQNE